MRKKMIAIGCMMALTAAMVTGCAGTSGSSSNSSTKAATEQNTDGNDKMQGRPQDDNSKMVKVTKVDGSTITAAVGENPGGPGGKGGHGGNGPDGQTPPDQKDDANQTDGNSSSDDKQASPERPDDNGSSNDSSSDNSSQNSDKKDDKGPQGKMEFTATDETLTFTITSDTKITTGGRDNQKEASADDIKENSILRVTVNDNNEAESIEIMGS